MGWKQYHLIFRTRSNIHIGYRKVGNVMMSRGYVHGRALRGAIINCLALNIYDNEPNPYQKAMDLAKDNIRFSYLWPAYSGDNSGNPKWDSLHAVFPFSGTDGLGGLYPKPISKTGEEFDFTFRTTEQRTAINPATGTAEEGLLFEVESISNYTRDGNPVFMVGTLWISEGEQDLENPEGVFSNIQLGGERTYGWGRGSLKVEETKTNQNPEGIRFKGHVPSHFITNNVRIDGATRVETLAGFEYKNNRYELTHRVVYEPGCFVDEETSFTIDDYGIWSQI
jgi:hypothetical protein